MRELFKMTATKNQKSPNINQLFSVHFEFLNRKSKCLKIFTKIIEIKWYNTCMPAEIILSKKTQKSTVPLYKSVFWLFWIVKQEIQMSQSCYNKSALRNLIIWYMYARTYFDNSSK